MALALFIGVILIFLWLGKKGREARAEKQYKKLSPAQRADLATKKLHQQKEIDEQITVILPTINHK